MRFQPRSFGFFLAVLVLVTGSAIVSAQMVTTSDDETSLIDPEGIIHELAPDTIPMDSLNPKPANRTRAIRLLLAVKSKNTGWNRQQAVYLLALFGHDYELNRDELLKVWRGCVEKIDGTICDEMTAMTLIGLYHQGHQEILRSLLAGCRNSDGALSEELGPFYSEQLERHPKNFVTTLATFAPKEQHSICWLAGAEDGGGMNPKTERKVLANLKTIGGVVSNRCAREVREANQTEDENNRDSPAVPPKND